MSKKTRLILADENELFRKSLVSLLKSKPEFEVTGDAKNGRDLLEQLKKNDTDIVILNVDMPGISATELLSILGNRFPEVKVIALNNKTSHHLTTDFMALGARCYLTFNCGVDIFFEAIKTVDQEGYYFDNSISKAMLGAIIKNKTADSSLQDIVFTSRETEIMKAVCEGKTNKEIALILHLSPSSIDFYKGRIYEKSNCNNTAMLVKFALKRGIVALS